jgi:hypothetical protein
MIPPENAPPETPIRAYDTLLAPVGLGTFWMCLNAFLHERGLAGLDLPLDLFDHRGREVILLGIYICFPFMVVTNYLGARRAAVAKSRSFWDRISGPFKFSEKLASRDQKAYKLAFFFIFHVFPVILFFQFSIRFLFITPPENMFPRDTAAWTKGFGMYESMTYFAWVPLLVGLFAALYLWSVISLFRALRRR